MIRLGFLGLLLPILGLYRRKLKLFAHALLHWEPPPDNLVHVPRKQANPWLDIIMQLKGHIVDAGNLARGMRDLVLWSLVVEFKKATVKTVSFFYFATVISSSPKTIVRYGKRGVKKENAPAGINRLAFRTALELLHGNGPNVLQVVGAGVRDDAIPDDG